MVRALSRKILSVLRRVSPVALHQLAARNDGAAALEFGLVAAPFLALLFGIMETGLVFFAGQTLESSAAQASRLVLTGQAQSQGFDQAAFQNAVCANLSAMINCANLMVDVRTYSNFSSANTAAPIDQNGNLQKNFTFQPGSPGSIVVVRLMYEWPVYGSLLGFNKSLTNLSDGSDLLMATVAFRNEPYQ
jgi:Flp pilus assembly protein TadG